MTIQGIRWDAHSCVPLKHSYAFDRLVRHQESGFHFASINVGMDVTPVTDIMQMIATFRRRIGAHPDLIFANGIDDVRTAAQNGQLAIAFDLEGAVPLLDNADMIWLYHRLGVRQMHFAYNRANAAAGGCYDPDAGLTSYGKTLVAKCEEVGITVDCSHLNERTSLQIMDIALKPIVFSHSNVRGLNPNFRNITNAMIDACAACDGVIGVTGMSNFLAGQVATIEGIVEQIDFIVQRTGPRHVGIGLDYVYDQAEDELPADADPSYWFPAKHGYDADYYKTSSFVPPEALRDLGARMEKLGYSQEDIRLIWGENFVRIAEACWKPA